MDMIGETAAAWEQNHAYAVMVFYTELEQQAESLEIRILTTHELQRVLSHTSKESKVRRNDASNLNMFSINNTKYPPPPRRPGGHLPPHNPSSLPYTLSIRRLSGLEYLRNYSPLAGRQVSGSEPL